ncbi:hypothetical protein [Leisingera sp.]|uniref:hypothetical protein n=1 Tax=Leisingera sp. TaxID=1879318 RepID=UPI002B2743AC|nr:hypothetical protein [Leisingera sp.]
MMDLARRMGLEFESLQFEKRDDARFTLKFSLSEQGTQRASCFEQRIRLLEGWAVNPVASQTKQHQSDPERASTASVLCPIVTFRPHPIT